MRKNLTLACLAAVALSVQASGDDTKLKVSVVGGSQAFDLASISKITFGNESFTVSTADGKTATFEYGKVSSIKFDDTPSSVGDIPGDKAAAQLHFRNGRIEADGWPEGKTATIAVYDMGGRVVLRMGNWDGTPVNVSDLADGIYLFSVDNQSIKFVK